MQKLMISLLVCAFFPTLAHAQGTADAAAAIAETRAVAQRVTRDATCLSGKAAELERVVRQMEDARRQSSEAGSDAQAREHAQLALRSLMQRAVRIERSITECQSELSARARRPGPPEGVQHRAAPRDPAAASVAQAEPSIRVIERDAVLQPNVAVVLGEQVDGTGRVATEEVRAGIRSVAARFSRCYDQFVDRGALERGTLVVTFRVTSERRTRNVMAHHGTLADARFVRCVRTAASRIRFESPPVGGDAVYSYTLRFGGR